MAPIAGLAVLRGLCGCSCHREEPEMLQNAFKQACRINGSELGVGNTWSKCLKEGTRESLLGSSAQGLHTLSTRETEEKSIYVPDCLVGHQTPVALPKAGKSYVG
jgi:hypothetical protein